MIVSVVRKGSIRTGPASKPRPRRIRPKWSQFRTRTSPGSGIDGAGQQLSGAGAAQPLEVFLVFDDRSQGRLYSVLRQLGLAQCNQRARPIQGLGDAGQFVKV